jgi:hypothetical protein
MAFCQNPAINKKIPEELSAKDSYFICSQHFDKLDYRLNQHVDQGKPKIMRLATSGAVPKFFSPRARDGDGSLISPNKPPVHQNAAQMTSLLKPLVISDDDEDSEDAWQYENYDENSIEPKAAVTETKGGFK